MINRVIIPNHNNHLFDIPEEQVRSQRFNIPLAETVGDIPTDRL